MTPKVYLVVGTANHEPIDSQQACNLLLVLLTCCIQCRDATSFHYIRQHAMHGSRPSGRQLLLQLAVHLCGTALATIGD
jgi:hypothetical protein